MENNTANFRFKKAEIGVFKHKNSDLAVDKFCVGCRILGFTMGRFSLIDLIYSLLKKTGKANVIVGTWSAGIKDVNQVKWMIDSDLISSFKLLTDHSYKTRQHKYAALVHCRRATFSRHERKCGVKCFTLKNLNHARLEKNNRRTPANKACN